MDEAARRVNPVPLQALMRLRKRREEEALHEVRLSIQAQQMAEQAVGQARLAVVRHDEHRRSTETGLMERMRNTLQTSDKILAARERLERLAEQAVRLSERQADAEQNQADAEAELAASRAEHARRVRARQKWSRTLERVETARRTYAEAQEEAELEEEAADRFGAARGAGQGSGR